MSGEALEETRKKKRKRPPRAGLEPSRAAESNWAPVRPQSDDGARFRALHSSSPRTPFPPLRLPANLDTHREECSLAVPSALSRRRCPAARSRRLLALPVASLATRSLPSRRPRRSLVAVVSPRPRRPLTRRSRLTLPSRRTSSSPTPSASARSPFCARLILGRSLATEPRADSRWTSSESEFPPNDLGHNMEGPDVDVGRHNRRTLASFSMTGKVRPLCFSLESLVALSNWLLAVRLARGRYSRSPESRNVPLARAGSITLRAISTRLNAVLLSRADTLLCVLVQVCVVTGAARGVSHSPHACRPREPSLPCSAPVFFAGPALMCPSPSPTPCEEND